MTKKTRIPWLPDKMGIIYCEHPDWPKPDALITLGKYTLFPCFQCWRQIKAVVLEELLQPYLQQMALEVSKQYKDKSKS